MSRFSSDPWADLASQSEVVDANVVLVVDTWPSTDLPGGTPPAAVTRTVVTVRLGAPEAEPARGARPVVITADAGADGRTALRLAAHMSIQRSVPLLVLDGTGGGRGARRVAGAVELLAKRGFDVRMVSRPEADAADPAVLVVPASITPDPLGGLSFASMLTVRAGQADADLDLTESLGKLTPARAMRPPVG